ncbi:hypothetical protein [Chryseobacterium wanjuense]
MSFLVFKNSDACCGVTIFRAAATGAGVDIESDGAVFSSIFLIFFLAAYQCKHHQRG